MRFPVEMVAQRSEEVVEVGDVIAQVLNVGDRHVHLADHAVGSGVELTHEVVHLPHVVDAGLHVVAHFEHVVHAVLQVGLVHRLGGALHAEHVRDRGVLDRSALRARDRLHPADSGLVEDCFGHPVDDEEVGRVPQVVIALDHQDLGAEPGGREVPFGRRETFRGGDVRR